MKSKKNYFDSPEFQAQLNDAVAKYIRPASETILDDIDIRALLKISRRTALDYRKKGILRSHQIEKKIYYFLDEVIIDIKKAGSGSANYNLPLQKV